jgi:hypothetical protein
MRGTDPSSAPLSNRRARPERWRCAQRQPLFSRRSPATIPLWHGTPLRSLSSFPAIGTARPTSRWPPFADLHGGSASAFNRTALSCLAPLATRCLAEGAASQLGAAHSVRRRLPIPRRKRHEARCVGSPATGDESARANSRPARVAPQMNCPIGPRRGQLGWGPIALSPAARSASTEQRLGREAAQASRPQRRPLSPMSNSVAPHDAPSRRLLTSRSGWPTWLGSTG